MTLSSSPPRRTIVPPSVVQTIVGVAARGVRGVHALGSTGAQVELGEVQAAVDLSLVAEYGVPIGPLAEHVRERVIHEVETLAGFEVTEVNIAVLDVHLDEESA